MAIQVVHGLQVVDVAHHDGERLLFTLCDPCVDLLLPLGVCVLVLYPRQGVDGRHPPRDRQVLRVFPFLANLRVLIQHADDQQRLPVLLHRRGLQPHVGRTIVHHQAIGQHKHAVPLDRRQDVLLCRLRVEQRLVFGVNHFETVFIN